MFRLFKNLFRVGNPTVAAKSFQSVEGNLALVRELERYDFFRYETSDTVANAREQIMERGISGVFGTNSRLFPADAEDLAEGGVGDFFQALQSTLGGQNGSLVEVLDHWGDNDYTVTVNGKEYLIWNSDELQRESERPGLTWGLSTVRTFQIVNSLLQAVGSKERLYALNGGNDLFGMLLTNELKSLIDASAELHPSDLPYIPADTGDGWYGQRH